MSSVSPNTEATSASERDVAAGMRVLAEQFAGGYLELDFSLGSLPAFEKIIAAARGSRNDALPRWGAYLGETIVRACGSELRWMDFAAAARVVPSVAEVGLADESAVVLVARSASWFPLVKINKFLDLGAQDSPAAFAELIVAMVRPPKTDVAEHEIPAAVAEVVRDFFTAPSLATLRALDSGSTWSFPHEALVYLLRELEARPAALYPFFGLPREGRGRHQIDLAGTAVDLAWFLLKQGLGARDEIGTLSAMLEDRDKRVREHAAHVLARWSFQVADTSTGVGQYERGDAAIRAGTLSGLRAVVGEAVMERIKLRDPALFAPVLVSALRTPAERTLAIDTVHQIAARVRADITPMLGPMLEVLDDGKPAQIEWTLKALSSHAYGIKHGRAPFDPRVAESIPLIVRRVQAPPETAKTTKAQIAARYTLSAYRAIAEHFDEVQQAALDDAFAAVSHIR